MPATQPNPDPMPLPAGKKPPAPKLSVRRESSAAAKPEFFREDAVIAFFDDPQYHVQVQDPVDRTESTTIRPKPTLDLIERASAMFRAFLQDQANAAANRVAIELAEGARPEDETFDELVERLTPCMEMA